MGSNMKRRGFLVAATAAAASIFVPQFGRFFREGSGALWQPSTLSDMAWAQADLNRLLKRLLKQYYRDAYPSVMAESPLRQMFGTMERSSADGKLWTFGVGVT